MYIIHYGIKVIITAFALVVMIAFAASADVVYRLPIRADSTAPAEMLSEFARAIDSALSARFEVIVADSVHPPDSNVCATSLELIDSAGGRFRLDLFLARDRGVASGSFMLAFEEIKHSIIVLSIQEILSQNSLDNLMLSRLRISGTAQNRVFVNGELSGAIPFESFFSPGDYSIEVKANRFLSAEYDIFLSTGQDTALFVDLRATAKRLKRRLFLGGAAFGVLAFASEFMQRYLFERYEDPVITTSGFDRRYRQYQLAIVARNAAAGASVFSFAAGFALTFNFK